MSIGKAPLALISRVPPRTVGGPDQRLDRRAHSAGAQELADLVNGHPENVDEVVADLAALLAAGGDAATVQEVVSALGLAWDDRAVQVLLTTDLTGHPGPDVRLALARALGGGPMGPAVRAGAITQLLRLSEDPVAVVRDWACFGLGALHADGTQVRDALAARLDDPHEDTRDEALVALARTGDPRALTRVGQLLAESDGPVSMLQLQAAVELAAPELVAVLSEIAQEWSGDEDDHTARLDRALRRSTPDAAVRAGALERQLVEAVGERLADQQAIHLTGSYPRTTLHFRTEPVDVGWWRRLWEDDDPDTVDVAFQVDNWIFNAPREGPPQRWSSPN